MTQMQFENSYGGYQDFNSDPVNPNMGVEYENCLIPASQVKLYCWTSSTSIPCRLGGAEHSVYRPRSGWAFNHWDSQAKWQSHTNLLSISLLKLKKNLVMNSFYPEIERREQI